MKLALTQIVIFDEDYDLFKLIAQEYKNKIIVVLKPLSLIAEINNLLDALIIIRDPESKVINDFKSINLLIKSLPDRLLLILKNSAEHNNAIYEPIQISLLFNLIAKSLSQPIESKIQMLDSGLYYDYKNQKICLNEKIIFLSEKENLIFKYLLDANKEVSREQLLYNIWKYKEGINTHTVETHIYRIRAKVKNDIILTTKSGNYKLGLINQNP